MEQQIRDDAILDGNASINRRLAGLTDQVTRLEILVLAVAISITAHYLRAGVK